MLLLAGMTLSICVWWQQVKSHGGTLSLINLPKPQYSRGGILRSAKSLGKSDKYAFHAGMSTCGSNHCPMYKSLFVNSPAWSFSKNAVQVPLASFEQKVDLVTSIFVQPVLSYRLLATPRVRSMRVSYLWKQIRFLQIRFLITCYSC